MYIYLKKIFLNLRPQQILIKEAIEWTDTFIIEIQMVIETAQ